MRKYLQIARNKNGKTMKQIATELDMSESYYSLIENGTRQADMSLSVMEKLSMAFGVPVEKIVEEEREYLRLMDTREPKQPRRAAGE